MLTKIIFTSLMEGMCSGISLSKTFQTLSDGDFNSYTLILNMKAMSLFQATFPFQEFNEVHPSEPHNDFYLENYFN